MGSQPALDVVERIATAGQPVDTGGELARLRRIVGLEIPDREAVLAVAARASRGTAGGNQLAGTADDPMLRSADLLEKRLAYLADYPSDDCPVCRTEGTVDAAWQTQAREQVDEQRRIAKIAQRDGSASRRRFGAAQGLPGAVPAAVQDARGLLDVEPVIGAWRPWVELVDESDPLRLAAGLDASIDPVAAARRMIS